MKKIIIILVCILVVLGLFVYLYIVNNGYVEEEVYTPEPEISDNEMRNTIITLYFENCENGEVEVEARLVDSKELLDNTCEYLVNSLIEGPRKDNLRRIIPEGTKLNGVAQIGETVTLDFSKEFVDNCKGDSLAKSNIIYSIVNTLTELKDVSKVKILIDGEESDGFLSDGISFRNEFSRPEKDKNN